MNGIGTGARDKLFTGKEAIPVPSIVRNLDGIRTYISDALSSVRLTIVLLVLMAASVLIGAWCPQISQSGEEKIFEQFGLSTGQFLIDIGVADIFHSTAFLL